jgi:hypothetical protein
MPAINLTRYRSVVKDLSSTTTVGGYKGRGTIFKINRVRVITKINTSCALCLDSLMYPFMENICQHNKRF